MGDTGTLAETKDGATWSNNSVSNNIMWGNGRLGNMPAKVTDPMVVKKADGSYGFRLPPVYWPQSARVLTPADVGVTTT